MPDLHPHEGLEESALLVALGYDPSQGRPGRDLLNNVLELRGHGRPINEQPPDLLRASRSFPDEWIRAISGAITGRPNAPIGEVIAALRHGPSRRVSPSP